MSDRAGAELPVNARALYLVAACVPLGACAFEPSGDVPDLGVMPAPDAAMAIDAPPATDAPVVPAGYEQLDGSPSRYRWSGVRADLATAARDCADDAPGATVAVIDGDAENKLLQDHVAARPEGGRIWLGIQDWDEEGEWRTLAFEPVAYTAWLDGEPNDEGDEGEDCAVLLARFDPAPHAGRWNDVPCSLERAYVCEWR